MTRILSEGMPFADVDSPGAMFREVRIRAAMIKALSSGCDALCADDDEGEFSAYVAEGFGAEIARQAVLLGDVMADLESIGAMAALGAVAFGLARVVVEIDTTSDDEGDA